MKPMTPKEIKELKPGDWIAMQYGSNFYLWYVAENDGIGIRLFNIKWSSDMNMWLKYERLSPNIMYRRGTFFVGSTKKKGLLSNILAFMSGEKLFNLYHPYKTPPKDQVNKIMNHVQKISRYD